jgi:LCP family protein required for cell wall assembly
MTTYADPPPRTGDRPRRRDDRRRSTPRAKGLKDPLWAKLSIIFGALVMVLSGLSVVVPKIAAAWFTSNIAQVNAIPEELRGTDISGPINFLLLGMDLRNSGPDSHDLIRADSIILVHIPASHDRVFMISMPRDARVKIPAYPAAHFLGETTKLNAAFAFAAVGPNGQRDSSPAGRGRGAALTMQTISDLVPGGLRFSGAAIIDFDGFKDVLSAIGGVDMCVDVDTHSIRFKPDGTDLGYDMTDADSLRLGKHYPVGCYSMQPWEALDYSRQRHNLPNGDYDRQRHQQQLLKAIVKKVASPDTLTNFSTIRNLQHAAGDLLTLDLGGNKLEDWVLTMSSLRADDLVMIKTNGGNYSPIGDGTSDERLSPETLDLLKSVQSDTVFDFLAAHSDWVAADK